MAIAAMFSGITLAHAGLGLVHGFASPLGGMFPIPHGVVCGTVMAPVFSFTIDSLMDHPENPAYHKLVIVSKVFADFKYKHEREYLKAFQEKLIHIASLLEVPRLSEVGVTTQDILKVVEQTGHKNHPVEFSPDQLREILESRI
jgi:alcohol dehydrogenase